MVATTRGLTKTRDGIHQLILGEDNERYKYENR